MPDRLVEHGVGETRVVLIEDGEIVEARVIVEGSAAAGTILGATLKQSGKPALATSASCDFLLPAGSSGVTEGARLFIEVVREANPGTEPWKRPLARACDGPQRQAPGLDGQVLPFPDAVDRLEQAGWSDLIEEARNGIVRFSGGELRVSPTPAMTLIDVDGHLPPEQLALAGAIASARTIRRHGIGGSIGIDLPTVSGKAQRQSAAAAIDSYLPQPYERTAMNGFGFIQLVRPRRHASLFELAQDRAAFEARALLRRAAFGAGGARRLAAHPAVVAAIHARPGWIEVLARQVGGAVTLRADPAIAIHGGYAENV